MKFIRFWKSIIWFIFILFSTLLPGTGSNRIRLFPHADKLIHLFLFLVFSLLLISDARRIINTSSIEKKVFSLVLWIAVSTGMFTELVQYLFIAERSGSLADFIADIIGIMAGLVIYKIITIKSKS
jgi:VanZ family protein